MYEETLTIDPEAWTVQVGEQTVPLTYQEFRLLLFLAEHPGKVFRRADLLRAAWATESAVSDRSVDLYIHRLREKLGDFGRRAIQTVVRVGYRFDVKEAGSLRLVQGRSPPGR
ncbi:MAG: winged helix-turn-helix transcriptional regulator [Chloroflexi bacterium]|nr:winged helix-turn-helix transcriptional regulator [Chloroflexota bacterium]